MPNGKHLQAFGHNIVDHVSHIRLVYAHTKSNRCNHHLHKPDQDLKTPLLNVHLRSWTSTCLQVSEAVKAKSGLSLETSFWLEHPCLQVSTAPFVLHKDPLLGLHASVVVRTSDIALLLQTPEGLPHGHFIFHRRQEVPELLQPGSPSDPGSLLQGSFI